MNFCNKIINNNFSIEDVKQSIDSMACVTFDLLPEPQPRNVVSNTLSILIDDILEMESISQEEKDVAILDLINRNQGALKDLAKQLIEKIESDEQEAIESGYCPILIKEYTEKKEE